MLVGFGIKLRRGREEGLYSIRGAFSTLLGADRVGYSNVLAERELGGSEIEVKAVMEELNLIDVA